MGDRVNRPCDDGEQDRQGDRGDDDLALALLGGLLTLQLLNPRLAVVAVMLLRHWCSPMARSRTADSILPQGEVVCRERCGCRRTRRRAPNGTSVRVP